MKVDDIFIPLPIVTKNNKGEDFKSIIKYNARLILSYYEGMFIHENNDETTVTYVGVAGSPDMTGIPIPLKEFEERLIPYLPIMIDEITVIGDFKKIPIRYKDFKKSELYGKEIYFDGELNVNTQFIMYYHPIKKVYNEEDGEIDVVYFCVSGSVFYTLLSLNEFESIINNNK